MFETKAAARDGNRTGEFEQPCSVLARELRAFGRIDTAGEVRIYGTVKGDVCASRVVLHADGFVEGNLAAQEIVLEGTIRGRVFALSVVIEDTAMIQGNVFHHELTMAAGAKLDGRAPWRPVNYFDDITHEFEGDADEHVRAQR